jgi:uncharacterized protein
MSRSTLAVLSRLAAPVALAAGLLWTASPAGAAGSPGPVGHWEGAVLGQGVNITLRAEFRAAGTGFEGTMDIPQQGATGMALKAVRFAGSTAHFELATGAAPGIFEGVLSADSINGSYTQGAFQGTFRLARAAAPPTPPPSAPPPYRELEVTFKNGGVTLAGTLTVPPGAGPHPAVVMITGSGPQNRDEELFSFRPFRLIADHLTRQGIAVLRYDDRGTAKSTGDFAASTTADFADDAHAAVTFLGALPDIDPKRIGLCGHSEGGLVAPMVAARAPGVAFVVLLAGPGVTGERILVEQGRLILTAGGAGPEKLAEQVALQEHIFRAVRGQADWDSLRAMMMAMGRREIALLPEVQRQAIGDPEKFLARTVDPQIEGSKGPWMKFFLDHDPAPVLEKVRCPVLGLFGEKDLQVPAVLDSAAVGAALAKGGNRDVTLRILPHANHLFLPSETGSPSEYAGMKKEFVPGFLDALSGWIRARCGM